MLQQYDHHIVCVILINLRWYSIELLVFLYNDYSWCTSVTSLINRLQWTTLQQRRDINKLITFYKIPNGFISLEFLNTLQPNTSCACGYDVRCRQVSTRVDIYLHSYLPSTIQLWNSLPAEVVYSRSLADFKNNLYVHYTHNWGLYITPIKLN